MTARKQTSDREKYDAMLNAPGGDSVAQPKPSDITEDEAKLRHPDEWVQPKPEPDGAALIPEHWQEQISSLREKLFHLTKGLEQDCRHWDILCERNDAQAAELTRLAAERVEAVERAAKFAEKVDEAKAELSDAKDEIYHRTTERDEWHLRCEKAQAEIARLTELHRRVRSSLQTELERGAITDTLWMDDNLSETIFDALDHALKPDTGELVEDELVKAKAEVDRLRSGITPNVSREYGTGE